MAHLELIDLVTHSFSGCLLLKAESESPSSPLANVVRRIPPLANVVRRILEVDVLRKTLQYFEEVGIM